MRFMVSRTSIWSHQYDEDPTLKPCEEAQKEGRAWFVHIESLDELCAFLTKYDQCVIDEDDGVMTLEIYDGYRE